MTARFCPDDLLAQRRRRTLSDLERQALAAHLAQCDLCRASETMATVFHDGQDVLPGDGEMVVRMAARASLASTSGRGPSRHRGWLAAAGVVLLCVGGGAFALVGGRWRPAITETPAPQPLETGRSTRGLSPAEEPTHSPNNKAASSLSAERLPAVEPPTLDMPARTVKKHVAVRSTDSRLVTDVAKPPATAEWLFAEAKATRRSGDLRRAVSLYQALQRQFPTSAQAQLSSISMGDVLIDLDDPKGALAAFDSYLAEVRSGSLREEALFGRSRCLKRLGQSAAEAETWRLLLRDFPRSAYESLAKQRLGELQ